MDTINVKAIVLRFSVIAFICGFSLSLSHVLTRSQIAINQHEHAIAQLQSIINSPHETTITSLYRNIYAVNQNETTIGHIFEITTNRGYNGDIKLWLAVSTKGNVMGARVIKHQETPGLGDKIDHETSNWISAFNGHSLQSATWNVRKDGGDFDQFTGATITPRAVIVAIRDGLISYDNNKNKWLR